LYFLKDGRASRPPRTRLFGRTATRVFGNGLTGYRAGALPISFRRIGKIGSHDFGAAHDQLERIPVMLRVLRAVQIARFQYEAFPLVEARDSPAPSAATRPMPFLLATGRPYLDR
jgi:hypothetical protein